MFSSVLLSSVFVLMAPPHSNPLHNPPREVRPSYRVNPPVVHHKEWPGHKYKVPTISQRVIVPTYRTYPCYKHQLPRTHAIFFAPVNLVGVYFNYQNGNECEIYQDGNDYVFINENHDYAVFRLVRPAEFTMIAGDWNPNTVCTVYKGWDGKPVLRFEEVGSGTNPGYWIQR